MTSLLRALLAGFLFLCLARASDPRPNVILIMADDLGYQDLGCYGHPSIKTPNLDRVAASGVRLTHFHSGATVCTPSRMALLTGAYPVRLGWTQGVVGYKMGIRDGLAPEALTIAEVFHEAGYITALSGKWHVGSLPDCRPHRQGFDEAFYLPLSNNQTKELWRGDEIVEKPFENRLLTEKITTEAIRFIRENDARPFFLYLPYTAPHFPVEPHPQWQGRSAFGKYGDVVEELDFRIGKILETLAELKLDRRTIIVFTSDNGPQSGEQAGAHPYRGHKWSPLEGGTRVPCVISWPGVVPAARVDGNLMSAMDLMPTLAEACGIDWKARTKGKPKLDGLSLWDSLLGREGAATRGELLHWHGMDAQPQAITQGDWKLYFDRRHALEGPGVGQATAEQNEKLKALRDAAKTDGAPVPFLFHLRDDPGETEDLSAKHPEKVKALRARADEIMADIKASGTLPLAKP